jgi:hypothetical protein
MTARKAAAGIVVLLLLALIGTGVVLIGQGADEPALTGALVGIGLGGLSLFVESMSLSWALRQKPSWTLGVSLGGFTVRLVLVVTLTLVFKDVAAVSASTFALTYVASFLAFVGIQVWAVNRMMEKAKPAGRGQEEGEA